MSWLGLAQVVRATEPVAVPVAVQELVFLTWPDFIDNDVVAEFEKQFNAKVRFIYFESDDARDELLAQNNASAYDVVLSDGISLTTYVSLGWLDSISEQDVPNLRHVDTHWRTAYPQGDTHGVPYVWGTVGIAYRRDLVSVPITSWADLFKPTAQLQGKILMIRNARDVIGAALKALGYSENSADPTQLALARDLIMGQKPHVKVYSYLALTPDSALVTGDVVAAMVFSGDALALQKINPNIAYVLPPEGSNICVDYLAITKASTHKKLAADFINFINEPKNSARVAATTQYATPSLAAQKYLPRDFFLNDVIYPPAAKMARSEYFSVLPPAALKFRNEIFQQALQ